jgi:hypothetical protein
MKIRQRKKHASRSLPQGRHRLPHTRIWTITLRQALQQPGPRLPQAGPMWHQPAAVCPKALLATSQAAPATCQVPPSTSHVLSATGRVLFATSHVSPAAAKPLSATGYVMFVIAHACLAQVNYCLPHVKSCRHKLCPTLCKQKAPRSQTPPTIFCGLFVTGKAPRPQAKPSRHKPEPLATGQAPSGTGETMPQHAARPPVCHKPGSVCHKA